MAINTSQDYIRQINSIVKHPPKRKELKELDPVGPIPGGRGVATPGTNPAERPT